MSRLQRRVEIRVPAHLVRPLREGIAWTRHRESVVFGLATHINLEDRVVLLVREIIPLPASAYRADPGHGASWAGAAMIPILNAGLAGQCGVIVFHSHPHEGQVSFSGDDSSSASQLLPAFQNVIPSRPHASLVLGVDHAAGMVLLPNFPDYIISLRVRLLGKVISDMSSEAWSPKTFAPDEIFDRQALLTGGAGEARLRRAKVAVVGLSGGGSHVVQQLAHIGVGEIIGIDGGRAKPSHRPRVVGLSGIDARLRRRKTVIMGRMVRRVNETVRFTGIPHMIPEQSAIDALKEADVVVGCVDNYHARADLQDLCARFLIPYIDVGLLIRPIEGGTGVTVGGNVITAIPGEFCQWCIGFLSQERLDGETGGRPKSYFEGADGQAQVVSMNGVLASAAVTEVLQLITGFAPVTEELVIKKYDGLRGTLEDWLVKPNMACPVCRNTLGAGDVIWSVA